jgi:hypothetical protein
LHIQRKFFHLIPFLLVFGWSLCGAAGLTALASPPSPDPDPGEMIPDIFKEPPLSENPTQVEMGAYEYFYHCMPCHGDQGQGLTDEFRQQWVPDHRNCWSGGCHGGRVEDQGFPIPREVPDLLGLEHFPTPELLFLYLQTTHPPQRPGALEESQYWAVTAFTLHIAGRLAPDGRVGPEAPPPGEEPASPAGAITDSADQLTGPPVETSANDASSRVPPLWIVTTVVTVIVLVALTLVWQARNSANSFIDPHDPP